MRTVRTKVYNFEELNQKAQQKALEYFHDLNTFHNWWSFIYMNAESIGIKITSFDIDQKEITGELLESFLHVTKSIFDSYDPKQELFLIAKKYNNRGRKYSESREENELLVERFLKEVLDYFLQVLKEDYQYRTSAEAIKESILANEFEFTQEGIFFPASKSETL